MLGFSLSIAASALVSCKDIVSKKLSANVSSSVSTFASFAYPLPLYIIIIAVVWCCGYPVFEVTSGFWAYAAARALTDTAAEWCKMSALAVGELSVVTSFFALYPILLLISSPFLTGDVLEAHTPLATAIIVAGTIIILYNPRGDRPISWRAIGLALAAAFFFSLNTALDRATVRQANPVFSAFVMTTFSAVFISSTLRKRWLGELITYRKLFATRGVFEVVFMIIKLWALTMLSAPLVVGIMRSSTVLNVIAGHFIFGEQHFTRRMLGATLVTGGVIYLLIG